MTPHDGEAVLLDARPHGRALAGPVLVLLLTAGAAGYLAGRAGPGPHPTGLRWAVLAAAVAVLLPLAVLPWLRWWSTRVLLTDRRLVLREGVLRRHRREVPLDRLSEVRLVQTLAQRAQRCGVLVAVADGAPLPLPVLGDVEQVRRALSGAVAARRDGPPRWPAPGGPPPR